MGHNITGGMGDSEALIRQAFNDRLNHALRLAKKRAFAVVSVEVVLRDGQLFEVNEGGSQTYRPAATT